MKKQITHLDLLREIKDFNINEERKYNKEHCMTFCDKVYGVVKGLNYNGVEDWRVRCDFKYLYRYGQDKLFRHLIKNPVFEYSKEFYESKNWEYFMFLYDKANFKKLPKEIVIPGLK